ncbi:hypothetical protein SteCoe_21132 [Stentor coeruleus]|uniref:Uncharacterized protein n=1 Tax=Stentor coeruleus TaxID=5963 RepID=A0A1R2BQ50_9CILI|nr:hypothetical protein SteCoe_21132 [Stentor coeruleus]
MASDEEFYDACETFEQLNSSEPVVEETPRIFFTDTVLTQNTHQKIVDFAEYKTDVSLPASKTELFSWTTLNLAKKANKDVKEFSGLEIIQTITLNSNNKRNWILKFSPDSKYLALAGESSIIIILKVLGHINEKNPYLFDNPEEYKGHEQSIVSISWNMDSEHFLSCGVDCLVLLWKIGFSIPIRQFLHENIVTCVGFNPLNENIFYSGTLGKKIFMWTVNEGILENTYQTQGIITAGSYSNNGTLMAVGLSNGECIIYEVNNAVLTFITQIHCRNRKGLKSSGKKVTGIEFHDDQYLLITTNDSRIRLYSLENFSLLQKYKGGKCNEYPLHTTFSHNSVHIIRGSEDGNTYIWNTFKSNPKRKWPSLFTNSIKNNSYEYFTLSKEKSLCDSIFASSNLLNKVQKDYLSSESNIIISHIILTTSHQKLYILYNQYKNIPW